MRQYNVNFFDRDLAYQYHDSVSGIELSDDYISIQNNTIEIGLTDKVQNGQYIYMTSQDHVFFGVVTNVTPKADSVTVTYKSFLALFDEDILFDTNLQNQTTTSSSGNKINSKTLENMLKGLIDSTYVNNSDTLQNLKIDTTVESNTKNWGFNLKSDTSGTHYCIVGLYSVLIVNAMKKYGVALKAEPDFASKIVHIHIRAEKELSPVLNIDGNLGNVTVQTLKMNDRPNGTNKLTVYNTDDYGSFINFYVYTDRTWGYENRNRIKPVVRDVKGAMPDSSIEDPVEAFAVSALDVAYGILSGLAWNNLIELEMAADDELVKPLELNFGQKIRLWYKGSAYESILTGIKITTKSVLLILGSERISLTKKIKA